MSDTILARRGCVHGMAPQAGAILGVRGAVGLRGLVTLAGGDHVGVGRFLARWALGSFYRVVRGGVGGGGFVCWGCDGEGLTWGWSLGCDVTSVAWSLRWSHVRSLGLVTLGVGM